MAGKGAVWKAVFAVPALGPGRAPADRPLGIVKIDHDDVARRLSQAELFEGVIISAAPQASGLVGNAQAVVMRHIHSASCRKTANGVPPPLTGGTSALPSARAGPGRAGRQQELLALATETRQCHLVVRARDLLDEACCIVLGPREPTPLAYGVRLVECDQVQAGHAGVRRPPMHPTKVC